SGVFVVRPIENSFDSYYFYYILNSEYFDRFIGILKAGSTISHLYQKDFTNFIFPLPSLEEQKKIATIFLSVDKQIKDNKELLNELKEIKKGLMQDLLTGKVRVAV
ncbi:MAG: restriction endonuclease subunit S, partial [Nanoarchaeota archaeon]|nr:restriction endonuclease subunit S [Nanoarchaeota archaeon]